MSDVHICLLSGQLLPNIIPILTERPQRVYIVATEKMVQGDRLNRIKKLMRREDIDIRIRKGAPSTGLDSIRRFAKKITDEISSAELGRMVVLNATGGTKLLSMGFVDVFQERIEQSRLRIIYTDTENRMIETLFPREQVPTSMKAVLKCDTYLACQGIRIIDAASDKKTWQSAVLERKDVTEFMAENCHNLGGFFRLFNKIIHGSRSEPGALSSNGSELNKSNHLLLNNPRGIWRETLKKLFDADLIYWDGFKKIQFPSVSSACYLGGYWLEEFAWLVGNTAKLQDIRCSAVGQWDPFSGPDAPTNEFDLLAVHDNRLLIIECKTGKKSAHEQSVAMRLESLSKHVGGLFGSCLLLSAQELSSTMRNRCRSLGITVIEKEKVTKLIETILQWKKTGVLLN